MLLRVRRKVVNQPDAGAGQREDDRPEVVRTRLEVNLKNLEPLLGHYRRQGKLLEVNGERAVDEITQDILRLLQEA